MKRQAKTIGLRRAEIAGLKEVAERYHRLVSNRPLTPAARLDFQWLSYLYLFIAEAEYELAGRRRKKVASGRRAWVQRIAEQLGRWPTADDVARAISAAGELGQSVIEAIAFDLERLREPQIRRPRRSSIETLQELEKKLGGLLNGSQ